MDISSQPPYLLGLRLRGRRVTVIGGGAVAARRVPALLEAGARVRIVSPGLSASLQEPAGSRRIEWEPRGYARGDCAGAWLGVCARAAVAATVVIPSASTAVIRVRTRVCVVTSGLLSGPRLRGELTGSRALVVIARYGRITGRFAPAATLRSRPWFPRPAALSVRPPPVRQAESN